MNTKMDEKIKKIMTENAKESKQLKGLLREDKKHDKIIERAKKAVKGKSS
jgi:hypothetical protein